MLGIRLLGVALAIGAIGGALAVHKIGKVKMTHKPRKNRVIEVELSEGVDPEDIIITVPRRTRN
jgi:uncharacterized protein YneF (UPF0154 family)